MLPSALALARILTGSLALEKGGASRLAPEGGSQGNPKYRPRVLIALLTYITTNHKQQICMSKMASLIVEGSYNIIMFVSQIIAQSKNCLICEFP